MKVICDYEGLSLRGHDFCNLILLTTKGGTSMDAEKLSKALNYIADATDTGYSAIFTFAVKEILDTKEKGELALYLRNLANEVKPSPNLPATHKSLSRF